MQGLSTNISKYDEGVVTRMKKAGFIILGKTATSQFGSLPYTEPPGFPPTRNPWNPHHTSGGSSGGAATAVAAGLCPIAHGSDGGGSIRITAACCGLVGLKPARGRVSNAPVGDYQEGIATHGPLAHTVADAAALLDIMAGYIPGDPYWLPQPRNPLPKSSPAKTTPVAHRLFQHSATYRSSSRDLSASSRTDSPNFSSYGSYSNRKLSRFDPFGGTL